MKLANCIFLAAGLLLAQQAPPVVVKRVPPATNDGIPSPDKYPFDQLISILNTDAPPARPVKGPTPLPVAPGALADVPKDFKPTRDVALPASAKEALEVGQGWLTEKHTPAPGKDGRVLYTFGAGLPTVVCAPLRVCVLELESGEKLTGEPHIGDAVRWIISPASSGQAEYATSMIVIKPKQPGLDTNLLVTTDRRAYYLRLISKQEDYIARVAFAYPEDESMKWKLHLAEQAQRRKEELEAVKVAPVESLDSLYFDYRIVGGDENIRPVRVVDDGKKTFIQMTPNAANREAPVLVVVGPDGPEMVNYRVKGDMYVVDRLFERGALILGVGKKANRAEIIRGTSEKKK
jgi:type IV secretion system protein TrbG